MTVLGEVGPMKTAKMVRLKATPMTKMMTMTMGRMRITEMWATTRSHPSTTIWRYQRPLTTLVGRGAYRTATGEQYHWAGNKPLKVACRRQVYRRRKRPQTLLCSPGSPKVYATPQL